MRPPSSTTTRRPRRTRASRGVAWSRSSRASSRSGASRSARSSRSTAPSDLRAMAWLFTKAALAHVRRRVCGASVHRADAVEQHGWLTAAQMIDGLALGETTPGPLIMVVAFVGFVGGWTQAALGPDALAAGGHRRRVRRHVLHVPAVVPVHPRRRAAGRVDARRRPRHRAARRRSPRPSSAWS